MSLEKRITEKEIFSGNLLTLKKAIVQLFDTKKASREYIETANASAVLALDETENLILVKQYRYPHKKDLVEIPAGKIEKNENPKEAAKRELLEETGYSSNCWVDLGELFPATYSTQKIFLYLAKNATKKQNPKPDEGEFLEILKIPFKKTLENVLNGKILDSKTIIAVLKYFAIKSSS